MRDEGRQRHGARIDAAGAWRALPYRLDRDGVKWMPVEARAADGGGSNSRRPRGLIRSLALVGVALLIAVLRPDLIWWDSLDTTPSHRDSAERARARATAPGRPAGAPADIADTRRDRLPARVAAPETPPKEHVVIVLPRTFNLPWTPPVIDPVAAEAPQTRPRASQGAAGDAPGTHHAPTDAVEQKAPRLSRSDAPDERDAVASAGAVGDASTLQTASPGAPDAASIVSPSVVPSNPATTTATGDASTPAEPEPATDASAAFVATSPRSTAKSAMNAPTAADPASPPVAATSQAPGLPVRKPPIEQEHETVPAQAVVPRRTVERAVRASPSAAAAVRQQRRARDEQSLNNSAKIRELFFGPGR